MLRQFDSDYRLKLNEKTEDHARVFGKLQEQENQKVSQ